MLPGNTSLAWLQYNGRYTPYFTVLQAKQQLFPAELNLAQTRASLFISLVNIYKAMGGGWVNEADRLTGAGPEHTKASSANGVAPVTAGRQRNN